MDYQILRSERKTVVIKVETDGTVTVRAPKRCSFRKIDNFVREKEHWIRRKQEEIAVNRKKFSGKNLTEKERESLRQKAGILLGERTALYAERMQVSYKRITIRDQKTRWGSCSTAGNLNFNWRLVLAPREVLDYVVIHELAHRREMNHSAAFWRIVEAEMPDYRKYRDWLKKNGSFLMEM